MILPESILKMIPVLDRYDVGGMDPVITHGWLQAMAQELLEIRERIRPDCHYCGTTFRLDEVIGGIIPDHKQLPPYQREDCPESGKKLHIMQYRHPEETPE